MENSYYTPIRKILQKATILLIRNELNEYFNQVENKQEFLDYLEYEFLTTRKNKIKKDVELLNGAFRTMSLDAESKTEYLEGWVQEKRTEKRSNNEKTESLLTINQIALKCFYDGLQVTRDNGDKIVRSYGHTSGDKLYQRYTYYSSAANRKGRPNNCTAKKLMNKITLLEKVIEVLLPENTKRAIDEVDILKSIYENEYH